MRQIIKDRIIAIALGVGLLLNAIIWVILKLNIRPTDIPITLHYNVYFGVDYLGKYTQIYSIPVVGLAILCINTVLAIKIFSRSKLSARILAIAALIIQLLLIVSSIALIIFNK